MAFEVFVDTSAYYAMLDPNDQWHDAVKAAVLNLDQQLRPITTDYVLDETVTLLQARGLGYVAVPWLDAFFSSRSTQVVWMTADRFQEVRPGMQIRRGRSPIVSASR